MKRAYADIPEGQMHYRQSGKGKKDILLLHMSGSSSDEYEVVGNLLAESNFNVLAVDLLGFGGSDCPPHYYTMDDHAKTVVAFLDSVGIDCAYIYGNLATANLAVHIGVHYPARTKGIMLGHPLYHPDPSHYLQKRKLTAYSAIQPKSDGSHMMELWERSAKYGASPDISDARCRCLHQAGELGESLHWALFEDTPIGVYLSQLRVPAVIVAYEDFGEPDLLKEATALVMDGKLDSYKNGNPYIARHNPEQVAAMIIKHFA